MSAANASKEGGKRYKIEPLTLDNKSKADIIVDQLSCLILDDRKIATIGQVFETELVLALEDKPSSLQMENTYIPELPDGTENGIFLALDLGGTNFRIILMELVAGEITQEEVKHYHISDEHRIGCGLELFDYIAECVNNFACVQGLTNYENIPLGFTFSFPTKQHSLDSGTLVTWTKTFNCPSVVDQDVVKLLRNSLKKVGRTNINVMAILNDTTGTLIQGARLDRNTRIGIVLGTGSNGCYIERAEIVKHWETQRHNEKNVIIDIEWGAFGDNGVLDFIKTKYDTQVDETSLLKNSFTYEKYISGKYMGEICRVIMQQFYDAKLFMTLLKNGSKFPKPWTFGTDIVSKIERSTFDNKYSSTSHFDEILKPFDLKYNRDYNADDVAILRYICGLISLRAAQLVAINTSVLLNRMTDTSEVTIAIDGSVYKHHIRVKHWIEEYTQKLAPTKVSTFMLAEDGSGKGAAFAAAIAERLKQRL